MWEWLREHWVFVALAAWLCSGLILYPIFQLIKKTTGIDIPTIVKERGERGRLLMASQFQRKPKSGRWYE